MEDLIFGAIIIALFVVGAILLIAAMVFLYHVFAALMPILIVIVLVVGVMVSFFGVVKNTILTLREVYGK